MEWQSQSIFAANLNTRSLRAEGIISELIWEAYYFWSADLTTAESVLHADDISFISSEDFFIPTNMQMADWIDSKPSR